MGGTRGPPHDPNGAVNHLAKGGGKGRARVQILVIASSFIVQDLKKIIFCACPERFTPLPSLFCDHVDAHA